MLGSQEPRLKHVPVGEEHPDLDAALELVAAAGIVLDPWQELVFRGSCLRRDGIWAAKQVGVCCPRQNGKNAILEARQLAGLFIFNERLQRYTAHLGDTAAVAFKRLSDLIESVPWLKSELRNIWRSNGKEAIELKNGNTIQFRTRTDRAGRGPSPNTVYFDEAMELSIAAVAAAIPSVAAKSMSAAPPQLWYTGSSVDQLVNIDAGIVFARIRDAGLKGDPETSWFEWSVDAPNPEEVPDHDSPLQWAIANPGMGIRISEEHIAFEHSSPMGIRGFCVERLGVGDWPSLEAEKTVISLDSWRKLTDKTSSAVDPVVFCPEVSWDRQWGAISVAGKRADGLFHVEVVRHQRGTGWIVPQLALMVEAQRPSAVVIEDGSPAGSLLPDLEQRRLPTKVEKLSSTDHGHALGALLDSVAEEKVWHGPQAELEAAIRVAVTRSLGDKVAWDRKKSKGEITALVSCTLALWGVMSRENAAPWVGWGDDDVEAAQEG